MTIVIDGFPIEEVTPTPCYRADAILRGVTPFCVCPACRERGAEYLETAQASREHLLSLIYRHTHSDYKGHIDGRRRSILINRNGGTCLVPLASLTDAEITGKLTYTLRQEQRRLAGKLAYPAI